MAIYVHLQFSLQNKKEQADFASSQHLKKSIPCKGCKS